MRPFERIMASLDATMIVVTTALGDRRAGCLVSFHAQSSVEPERYTVWLSKANHTFGVMQHAGSVGIHFLARHQRSLAVDFGTRSGYDVDKFVGYELQSGTGGVPLLVECANRLIARKVAVLDEGSDHVCVVTEPERVWQDTPFAPLRFHHVADLDAGHAAEERRRSSTVRAVG